jgi:ABC-type branched-subunit amino acid transport system permease subunit
MFGIQLDAQVPRPKIGPVDASSDKSLYYLMLAVVTVFVIGILAVQRGRFGRMLRALAESPTMLSTHGLELNLTRLLVFCLSAFFAGVAGALAVTQTGVASGVTFGPIQSLLLLVVLGISGTSRLLSPVIAALLYAVLPGYVTSLGADQKMLIFGGAALVGALILARKSELGAWFALLASSSEFRKAPSRPLPGARRREGPARHSADSGDGVGDYVPSDVVVAR